MIARLLREPLLQFLVLGAILFALHGLAGKPSADAPEKIVVSASRIANLGDGFARTWRRPPSEQELQGLIGAPPLSINASAEANVRLSMPWCANSRASRFRRPALSSTTITSVGCAIISVSSPEAYMAPRGGAANH